jgi:hypothetical protein
MARRSAGGRLADLQAVSELRELRDVNVIEMRLLQRLAQPPRERPRSKQRPPLIRSLEPGEEWSWCYLDDIALLIPEVHGETRIPPSPLG